MYFLCFKPFLEHSEASIIQFHSSVPNYLFSIYCVPGPVSDIWGIREPNGTRQDIYSLRADTLEGGNRQETVYMVNE